MLDASAGEAGIVLSPEEIKALTGYTRATKQLEELRRQGFVRARHVNGQVIVERAHYEAVCAGIYGLGPLVPKADPEPELCLEFNRRPRQHRRRP